MILSKTFVQSFLRMRINFATPHRQMPNTVHVTHKLSVSWKHYQMFLSYFGVNNFLCQFISFKTHIVSQEIIIINTDSRPIVEFSIFYRLYERSNRMNEMTVCVVPSKLYIFHFLLTFPSCSILNFHVKQKPPFSPFGRTYNVYKVKCVNLLAWPQN